MNTIEIENLSFQELKQRCDEIVGSLVAESNASGEVKEFVVDVARRYVQARTDAKMRDEKMSEQSETITNLNHALGEEKQKSAGFESMIKSKALDVDSAVAKLRSAEVKHSESLSKLTKDFSAEKENLQSENASLHENMDTQVSELQHELIVEKERSARLKEMSIRNDLAINAAAKSLNDAVAARQVAEAEGK